MRGDTDQPIIDTDDEVKTKGDEVKTKGDGAQEEDGIEVGTILLVAKDIYLAKLGKVNLSNEELMKQAARETFMICDYLNQVFTTGVIE